MADDGPRLNEPGTTRAPTHWANIFSLKGAFRGLKLILKTRDIVVSQHVNFNKKRGK